MLVFNRQHEDKGAYRLVLRPKTKDLRNVVFRTFMLIYDVLYIIYRKTCTTFHIPCCMWSAGPSKEKSCLLLCQCRPRCRFALPPAPLMMYSTQSFQTSLIKVYRHPGIDRI